MADLTMHSNYYMSKQGKLCIISKARATDLPIDIQFKLFDTLVLPIGICMYNFVDMKLRNARKVTFKIL